MTNNDTTSNMDQTRLMNGAAGGALILMGLKKRGFLGLLMTGAGGYLAYKAATGNDPVMAAACGVPVRTMALVFAMLVWLAFVGVDIWMIEGPLLLVLLSIRASVALLLLVAAITLVWLLIVAPLLWGFSERAERREGQCEGDPGPGMRPARAHCPHRFSPPRRRCTVAAPLVTRVLARAPSRSRYQLHPASTSSGDTLGITRCSNSSAVPPAAWK